jgi:hypothetical protein
MGAAPDMQAADRSKRHPYALFSMRGERPEPQRLRRGHHGLHIYSVQFSFGTDKVRGLRVRREADISDRQWTSVLACKGAEGVLG